MDDLPRLLSLLSHELRSPLGVVRGYLRLLEQMDDTLSDRHRHAVDCALRASDRAAYLLDQASLLAQLRRHEIVLDFKSVALEAVVAAAADAVLLPSDPVVRVEVGTLGPRCVSADEALLSRALTTLISAVVRAQPRDTIVRITGQPQTKDGANGVDVSISSPERASTLREGPLDSTRGGLGLDLPIAESLAAAHRGQLRELRDGDRLAGVIVWLPTTG